MKYLTVAVALLSVPAALAKLNARDVTPNPNAKNQLGRSASRSVHNRQTGEYCGDDDAGNSHYCEDPLTTCCTGYEIWQCAPIDMQECCTTGYHCEAGTYCYLSAVGEQLCLTQEEIDADSGLGGDLGDDLGDDLGSDIDDLGDDLDGLDFGDDDTGDDTGDDTSDDLGSSGDDDTTGDDSGDDDDSSGGVLGGGRRKKGGSSGSGAPKAGAGHFLAGVIAIGAVLVVQG